MLVNKKQKQIQEFINLILKLNPMETIGIAKITCAPIVNSDNEPIPFDKLLVDMTSRFANTNRQNRRDILELMRATIKDKDKIK